MTLGNQFLAVPTDYLASFSMSIENSGSKVFLLQKDVNFLQESYPRHHCNRYSKILCCI